MWIELNEDDPMFDEPKYMDLFPTENETADGYSVFILIIKISVSHRIYVKNVTHFGFKQNMVFKWIGPHQRSYAHMMKWKKMAQSSDLQCSIQFGRLYW